LDPNPVSFRDGEVSDADLRDALAASSSQSNLT
jgi:hypothetical protein